MYSSSSSEIIKDLLKSCTTLKSLNLDSTYKSLLKFAARQTNLDTLLLQHISNPTINDCFVEHYKLNLKSLKIFNEFSFDKNILNFLLSQSESVENLTLRVGDFRFFRLISQHFHEVSSLRLDLGSSFTDSQLEEMKKFKLPNVTELSLSPRYFSVIDLHAIIEVFPNVEKLNIDNSRIPMHGLLEKLPNIQSLYIMPFNITMILFTKNSSLKELNIAAVQSVTDLILWKKVAENFPNLEMLRIRQIEGYMLSTCNEVEILMQSLKHFKKLKKCVIIGYRSSYFLLKDSDHVAGLQRQAVVNVPELQLVLKINSQSKIYCSDYFNTVLVNAKDKLIKDFQVQSISVITRIEYSGF